MRLKYVPTFESFLNEAKVELGSIDSGSMDDKWKMEQVNDILKGAVGKTCSFLDIISLRGHIDTGFKDGSGGGSTKNTPDSVLKNIKCKIVEVNVSGSYADLVHFVSYTFDAAPYDGYKYRAIDGKPDLTGEVSSGYNRARDENGKQNGAGVKFKDFPSIYPDFDAKGFVEGGYEPGKFVGQDTFLISYPKPNGKRGLETFSRFADIFGLGDITPNFPDAKGNVTDYDNIDYYDKLSVNCYQFIKGSMSKLVGFIGPNSGRGDSHTSGDAIMLCHKKDLKKIHEDLFDGWEGKKPRLNSLPLESLDAKAEEKGSVIDSAIYQKKWAKVCQFLGARDTSDLVLVNVLMKYGGGVAQASNTFSEEEIKHARSVFNGFSGWSSAKVPEGIAPLVKRIRVKKYASGKLS